MVIYFAYNQMIELDDSIVTFLYLCSTYDEYHPLLIEKSKVLFYLMDR